MESKIRIKIGQTEVEYEGSETFIKEELMNFVKTVMEWSRVSTQLSSENRQIDVSGEQLMMTTGSIAAKISCSSEVDLILAAAANFTLVQNRETFTRQELLSEMQSAPAYYKSSYRNNLSKSLNQLVKAGKLNERTSGQYALTADTRKDLQTKLAG